MSMMKIVSFLRLIFMPTFVSAPASTNSSPSHFYTLFSTLSQNNIPPLRTPFAEFAASRFNLSSADISRMLKFRPSLNKPKTLQNAERVVDFLTKYGCTEHHIARIMRSAPSILAVNAEKLLQPKVELLKDLGIAEKDLPKLLLVEPTILCSNLQNGLLPNITFLKSLFQSQNLLLKAVKRDPYILCYSLEKKLRPSLAFWEGCGLQGEELARFLSSFPSLLRFPSLTPPKVDFIRKIDISKESKMYKYVVCVLVKLRMENLESKIDTLRQWGLSAEEIWELFRTCPTVFNLSKGTLQKKMEVVVITMELPPNSVVKHSSFLRCSLEKVAKPRFAVFQHMKSMNGVEHLKSKQLYSLIGMSEANFVKKILKGHPELETLYALHGKTIPNV